MIKHLRQPSCRALARGPNELTRTGPPTRLSEHTVSNKTIYRSDTGRAAADLRENSQSKLLYLPPSAPPPSSPSLTSVRSYVGGRVVGGGGGRSPVDYNLTDFHQCVFYTHVSWEGNFNTATLLMTRSSESQPVTSPEFSTFTWHLHPSPESSTFTWVLHPRPPPSPESSTPHLRPPPSPETSTFTWHLHPHLTPPPLTWDLRRCLQSFILPDRWSKPQVFGRWSKPQVFGGIGWQTLLEAGTVRIVTHRHKNEPTGEPTGEPVSPAPSLNKHWHFWLYVTCHEPFSPNMYFEMSYIYETLCHCLHPDLWNWHVRRFWFWSASGLLNVDQAVMWTVLVSLISRSLKVFTEMLLTFIRAQRFWVLERDSDRLKLSEEIQTAPWMFQI